MLLYNNNQPIYELVVKGYYLFVRGEERNG
uniref:Uncharacterized protein n=1 Tax=Enterococcus faecium TaxID=1352 RepID=A0A1W6ASI9_ENTFC|nr:hypothetical protein [Enterococcus faecium]